MKYTLPTQIYRHGLIIKLQMRAIESTERRSGEARVTMEETLDSGIGSIGTPKRAIDLDKPGQMN